MKICGGCKRELTLSEFNRRGTSVQSRCRTCHRELNRLHYQKNKIGRKKQIKDRRSQQLQINREYVLDWLRTHPCVDCGESRIVTLEFDHVRGTKTDNISVMVAWGYALDTVIKEIEKCDVRCANCHRLVTAQRAGWDWKFD